MLRHWTRSGSLTRGLARLTWFAALLLTSISPASTQFVTTGFSGSLSLATAIATIPLPIGIYAMQARVEL
ncbi:MAG: hypothetical protein NTY35_03695 [Planctomycetota bacterium]|nr:hypothetical protein [Planctomycetota bacterium]